MAKDNLIWQVITGSKAYGLDTPTSDTDTRGLFIAPKEVVLDPFQNVEQAMDKLNDVQIYELRKFMFLLSDANPNIIEVLFIQDPFIQFKHPIMDALLGARDMFLTKKVRHTFSGYAFAQLKRIKGHNKWITNPQPVDPPNPGDYVRLIGANGWEVKDRESLDWLFKTSVATKVNEYTYKLWRDVSGKMKQGFLTTKTQQNPSYIDIDAERLRKADPPLVFVGVAQFALDNFRADHRQWKQYWEWKNNRNESRAVLEEAHGYDTKHAMHLVRLLRMGTEILKGEGVKVHRVSDGDELRAIRAGAWTYEKVLEYADQMDSEMESLYNTSTLPYAVDKKAVSKLYIDMCEQFWRSS